MDRDTGGSSRLWMDTTDLEQHFGAQDGKQVRDLVAALPWDQQTWVAQAFYDLKQAGIAPAAVFDCIQTQVHALNPAGARARSGT